MFKQKTCPSKPLLLALDANYVLQLSSMSCLTYWFKLINQSNKHGTVVAQMPNFDNFDDLDIQIHLLAIGEDGRQERRVVPLSIRNQPIIRDYGLLSGGNLACLSGGVSWVHWNVSNVTESSIVETGTGPFFGDLAELHTVRIPCRSRLTLRSVREGTNFFGGSVEYVKEEALNLAPIEIDLVNVTETNIPYALVTGGVIDVARTIQLGDPSLGVDSPSLSFRIGDPGTYTDESGGSVDVEVASIANLRGRVLIGRRDVETGQIVSGYWQNFETNALGDPSRDLNPPNVDLGETEGNEVLIPLSDPAATSGYGLEPRMDYQLLRVELYGVGSTLSSRINLMEIPASLLGLLSEGGSGAGSINIEEGDVYQNNLTTTDIGLVAWYRFLDEGDTYNWSLHGVTPGDYDLTLGGVGAFQLLGGHPGIAFNNTGTLVGEGASEDIHGSADALTVEMVLNVDSWPMETKTLNLSTIEDAQQCGRIIHDPVTFADFDNGPGDTSTEDGAPNGTLYGVCDTAFDVNAVADLCGCDNSNNNCTNQNCELTCPGTLSS